MNKCTRNDFDELELISGVCKFESVCAIKGLCPMQELINEHYANLENSIFCYAIGTAKECPDCINQSCYKPCKQKRGGYR
jgi:hypothetical protein